MPVEQATLLHDALVTAQVPVELLIIQNSGHGLEPVGGQMVPPIEQVFAQVITFLNQNL